MTEFYSDAATGLQQAFETEALAVRMHETIVHAELSEADTQFIESLNCFFLATVNKDGFPQCSYKGGATGFIRAIDAKTLVFPGYDGNGMYLSAGNIQETANVGMLFIDFETPSRLRVNGAASIDPDDKLLTEFPEAQFVTRVSVREIFMNCGRYIHPSLQKEQSRYAPAPGHRTPIADWKKIEFFQDVLPPRDIAALKDNAE